MEDSAAKHPASNAPLILALLLGTLCPFPSRLAEFHVLMRLGWLAHERGHDALRLFEFVTRFCVHAGRIPCEALALNLSASIGMWEGSQYGGMISNCDCGAC